MIPLVKATWVVSSFGLNLKQNVLALRTCLWISKEINILDAYPWVILFLHSICRLESLKKLCIIWQDNWKLLLFVGDYDYLVKLLEEILRLLIVAVILLAA